MIKLNFNNARCGKTFYEMDMSWKDLKITIKRLLDKKDSTRLNKINLIISLCERYKKLYLISKEESDLKC